MYTLKQLIDKAYDELLVAGFSEKTVYGANWYIWNRLIRKHGENAIFEESIQEFLFGGNDAVLVFIDLLF